MQEMLRCPFFDMTARTTLGLVLDDLTEAGGLVENIMILFDGKSQTVQVDSGGILIKPRTSFMTALNMKQFKYLSSITGT